MTKAEKITLLEQEKIVAILRGFTEEQLYGVVDALCKGGIRFAEVTFDATGKTPDEEIARRIEGLVSRFGADMCIGAGTVLKTSQVDLVADVGGSLIVSPDVCEDVIKRTVERGLISVPGALTPTECMTAHKAGADFIKLFPVTEIGPSYCKSLCAPLSHLKMLAVGGVGLDDIPAYLKAGAVGFGIGGSLADKQAVAKGNYAQITLAAQAFVAKLKGN